MTVADDCGYAGDRRKLVRRALGIAAGDNDFCAGVAAVGAANGGPGLAVGFASDAAGVDDDEVGGGGTGFGKAAGAQVGADGFAVGASGSAAEVLDVKARHLHSVYSSGCEDWTDYGRSREGSEI